MFLDVVKSCKQNRKRQKRHYSCFVNGWRSYLISDKFKEVRGKLNEVQQSSIHSNLPKISRTQPIESWSEVKWQHQPITKQLYTIVNPIVKITRHPQYSCVQTWINILWMFSQCFNSFCSFWQLPKTWVDLIEVWFSCLWKAQLAGKRGSKTENDNLHNLA